MPCSPLAECGDFFRMADALKIKIAGVLANIALLLASCLVGLLLCEAGLRLFHPQYRHLAEAAFIHDPNIGFIRKLNHCVVVRHPDTRLGHLVCHNNSGLRQHRSFSAADLESSVNIGFFGDSFTENTGMEAQFSFTEPLDYLLNLGGGVNVLNFGVDGYGTSQSLLRYEMSGLQENLDHVFYVHCENDLMDNITSGLFRLGDAGQLVRGEATPSGFSLLSKLHLPYLVMDAAGRLSMYFEETKDKSKWVRHDRLQKKQDTMSIDWYRDQPRAFALFRQILRRWKTVVENNGASFQFVRLPSAACPTYGFDSGGVDAIVKEEGVQTISLRDCFGERDPVHLRTPWQSSPYRFKQDFHWNEAGNRLAAVCLHRFLESALELPRLSEEEVEQALGRYYSAFEASPSLTSEAVAIRRKYGELEGDLVRLPALWTPSPDKLVIRSHFEVYLHDGWLVYVKDGCTPADSDALFFLHVFPADVRDLLPNRRVHGFNNMDFSRYIDETMCMVGKKLPDYAIKRIRTGQFVEEDNGGSKKLWEGEHVFSES